MRWTTGLLLAIGLSLAAGAAAAQAYDDDGGYDGYDAYAWGEDDAYRDDPYAGGGADYDAAPGIWSNADGSWFIHGHRAAPGRERHGSCACRNEVSLGGSFFADAGGVGPIPSDGGYGGGYVIFDGGGLGFTRGSGRAFAGASARATANVSVIHRGGFRGGHGGKGHGGPRGH